VLPVVQEVDPSRAALHEERHEWRVGLGRVAVLARQDQVVRTIVSRLSPAGPHVIEGYGVIRGFSPAISANRAVLCKEPIAVRLR
jgi:hypothetical protein